MYWWNNQYKGNVVSTQIATERAAVCFFTCCKWLSCNLGRSIPQSRNLVWVSFIPLLTCKQSIPLIPTYYPPSITATIFTVSKLIAELKLIAQLTIHNRIYTASSIRWTPCGNHARESIQLDWIGTPTKSHVLSKQGVPPNLAESGSTHKLSHDHEFVPWCTFQ